MVSFRNYIPNFIQLLATVNANTVASSGYAYTYLQELLLHKNHYLHLYAAALDKAFAATTLPKEETILLDFGCGNGLLALFAKYCGVKEVHAADMNPEFVLAAQQLSKQLNIPLDGWLIGSENILPQHFAGKKLDIVIGTDVIEHVYSLHHLFGTLQEVNPAMVTVFTTASVAENPIQNKKLQKLQWQDEYKGSNALHSNSQYAGLPFREIRARMIGEKFTELDDTTVKTLANATRGLQQQDIYTAVQKFIASHTLPTTPTHPTNTCDPTTGSFTERLLTIEEYRTLYGEFSFVLKVETGFYNAYDGTLKSKFSKLLNKLVDIVGIRIAPFVFLVGRNK
jgi:2-polyprenyl-3-methyl-5-hydroxy-6-metoxy-1,4-benzoquinol methylase